MDTKQHNITQNVHHLYESLAKAPTPQHSFAENPDNLFVGKRAFMGYPQVADEDITNIGVCN
ncbi:hypothetical protein CBW58_10805 [Yersinia frederiksenii]|nr:hypothetical protein CBW58_10805 [Yersinia frederiksenii]